MILRSLDESSSDLASEFGSLDFLNYTREFTNGWRAQMMGRTEKMVPALSMAFFGINSLDFWGAVDSNHLRSLLLHSSHKFPLLTIFNLSEK